MAEVRVTQAGHYIEITGPSVRVTQAGHYVEVLKAEIRATVAGHYVELVKPEIRVSVVGYYVELEESGETPIGPGTRVIYHGVDITEHVHSFQLEAAINQFETTSLAAADHTKRYGSGLAKWRLALQGWYSHRWDEAMMPDAVDNGAAASAAVLVQAPHPAHAAGPRVRYDWPQGKARVAAVGIKGGARDATSWDAELILSGAPERTVD